jgi:septation ring formation regulator EzrA
MAKLLGFKDSRNIRKLGEIRGEIYRYASDSTKNAHLKQKILDDLTSFRQEIQTCLQNKSITGEQAESILAKLEELQTNFSGFEEGKIQQLLTIYKKILPQGE